MPLQRLSLLEQVRSAIPSACASIAFGQKRLTSMSFAVSSFITKNAIPRPCIFIQKILHNSGIYALHLNKCVRPLHNSTGAYLWTRRITVE